MKYIITICLLFALSRTAFALKEIEYKKYVTYDGKEFNSKEEAASYEKIMSQVNILMEAFHDDREAEKERRQRDIKNLGYTLDCAISKKLDDYKKLLYECFKKLAEQGFEIKVYSKEKLLEAGK